MKRFLNMLVAIAGSFSVVVAAAVAVATINGSASSDAPTTGSDAAYAAETLPAPPPTTRASTAYFDGINEGVIAIGAYE